MSALPLFASTVYFIRIGKFIKIGVTTDLEQRLAAFRGASAEPMEVLLTIPGRRDVEQRLHKLCSIIFYFRDLTLFRPHRHASNSASSCG
jgi:hypothetical protein